MTKASPATPPPATLRIMPDTWLKPLPLARWFGRRAPLVVDIGCGKGRFLLARAEKCPDINFLGIERMLRRIRKVDHKGLRRGLSNLRLLRMEGYYATSYLVAPEQVRTYYIFFPDPWPKKRHHDQRLFNAKFMMALHRTLEPGGEVHVATDHLPYFQEISDQVDRDSRFDPIEPDIPVENEQTEFEQYYIHQEPIGRCSFKKRKNP